MHEVVEMLSNIENIFLEKEYDGEVFLIEQLEMQKLEYCII